MGVRFLRSSIFTSLAFLVRVSLANFSASFSEVRGFRVRFSVFCFFVITFVYLLIREPCQSQV
jgi:hypothetical protein